jgi:hypothetical protein
VWHSPFSQKLPYSLGREPPLLGGGLVRSVPKR